MPGMEVTQVVQGLNIPGLLLTLLQAVLVAAIPIIAKFVTDFIRVKVDEVQTRIQSENIQNIINRVSTLVADVVDYVSQTYVDDLKKSDQFSVEEQLAALEMAYRRTLGMIDENAKSVLDDVFGDVNTYIFTLIEAAVKSGQNSDEDTGEAETQAPD